MNKDGSYTSNKVSDQTKSDYESSGGKYDKYDSGGVLRGLGGIKATEEDEMILPPDITAAMLTPAADATFQARLAELGSCMEQSAAADAAGGDEPEPRQP